MLPVHSLHHFSVNTTRCSCLTHCSSEVVLQQWRFEVKVLSKTAFHRVRIRLRLRIAIRKRNRIHVIENCLLCKRLRLDFTFKHGRTGGALRLDFTFKHVIFLVLVTQTLLIPRYWLFSNYSHLRHILRSSGRSIPRVFPLYVLIGGGRLQTIISRAFSKKRFHSRADTRHRLTFSRQRLSCNQVRSRFHLDECIPII